MLVERVVWKISIFAMLAPEASFFASKGFSLLLPSQGYHHCRIPANTGPQRPTKRNTPQNAPRDKLTSHFQSEQTPRFMPSRYPTTSSRGSSLSASRIWWLLHGIHLQLLGVASSVSLLNITHVGKWWSANRGFCRQRSLHSRRLVGTSICQRALLHSRHTDTSTSIHGWVDEIRSVGGCSSVHHRFRIWYWYSRSADFGALDRRRLAKIDSLCSSNRGTFVMGVEKFDWRNGAGLRRLDQSRSSSTRNETRWYMGRHLGGRNH